MDLDPVKVDYTKHNAKIYELTNYQVIKSDFLKLDKIAHVDAVFLSPPWGGTGY